jgi:hypothetical protein
MSETDVFGVEDPESARIGLVSVMGALGEHFLVAVYRDLEAFYRMRRLTPDDIRHDPAQILNIPHLQASFEDRGFVEAQDHRIIKELGLRFRGENAWPVFRSYRTGYHPWYLEPEEVLRLSVALEQLLDVAPRLSELVLIQKRLFLDERNQPSAISCQQNLRKTIDWLNAESCLLKDPSRNPGFMDGHELTGRRSRDRLGNRLCGGLYPCRTSARNHNVMAKSQPISIASQCGRSMIDREKSKPVFSI